MCPREFNEFDEDEYLDYLNTPVRPERDPDADYDAKVEAELVAKHYPGSSLIEDAAAVFALGQQLRAKMPEPEGEDVFQAAKRRDKEAAALELSMKQMRAGLTKAFN